MNPVTGKVGPSTQATGDPTNQVGEIEQVNTNAFLSTNRDLTALALYSKWGLTENMSPHGRGISRRDRSFFAPRWLQLPMGHYPVRIALASPPYRGTYLPETAKITRIRGSAIEV